MGRCQMKWKQTLWILWAANFAVTAGMSLVIPFLPLYIETMGVHNLGEIERWSGWIFAGTFMTSFIFQPIWGRAADKYGRKIMMLRAGFSMSVVTVLMGFATAPWQLLALRLVNGVFSGFIPMSISLQASITPDKHSGRAFGTLQTGAVAGSLTGPLLGGLLAEHIGFSHVFFLTGIMLLVATMIVAFFVKEARASGENKTTEKARLILLKPLLPVFAASFVTQLGMMSIEPIVTIYTKTLYHGEHLAFIAGLVVAMTGFANIIGSPTLGRLVDKIGHRKVLSGALFAAALSFLPQALAPGIGVLLFGRFMLGLFVGGMLPTLNVMVKKRAPKSIQATAYGLNTSALFLGNLMGPIIGGHLSALYSIRSVFYVTMTILLINSISIYANRSLDEGTNKEGGIRDALTMRLAE